MKAFFASALVIASTFFLGAGCTLVREHEQTRLPVVATTIIPLNSAVQNILAGVADVETVLPPGADPHDVSLSTDQIQSIQNARVIVTLGLHLDDWVQSGIAATGSKAPVIIASRYLDLSPSETNPHVWLSPKKMLVIVEGLEQDFENQFPESKEKIAANADAYEKQLHDLDESYEQIRTLPQHEIVTLHDAFGYLAQDYGLTAVAIKDIPEENPSPEDVAKVIAVLNKNPRMPIFAESEVSPGIVTTIAHDTGRAVNILDPIEVAAPTPDAYIKIMRSNLMNLIQALQ
ncbi:MAG: metal ABC transporter substrate-binding protein [Candidatus Magasanikbacteria bacterium]|nr:metal ABC transporter substrate-binding protein [Candidatus Magasanikbacteria bacterium]